jgi:formamidopyrimidine-DNA glycosylase
VPELPEVETIVRDLRPQLVGRRLTASRCGDKALRRPWNPAWEADLRGRRVHATERRGKWIVLYLDAERYLLVHLGMTGQLTVVPAAAPLEAHTHLVFNLEPGREQLRFRDIRRFGSATLLMGADQLQAFFDESGLGPEPFGLDPEYWRSRLLATRRNLKAVLLDQCVVAGVGNIYADESLFEAKLPPTRLGCQLSARQTERLRQAVVTVLERAIAKRGSSIRNYVGGSGLRGAYQREFRVYGQTGKPCPRCGRSIALMRLAGRATHYCPKCQNIG